MRFRAMPCGGPRRGLTSRRTLRPGSRRRCSHQTRSLRRRLQLAGLAHRQGARHFGAPRLRALRDGAVLLLDRRPRPRTRHRSAAGRGETGADGLGLRSPAACCPASMGPALPAMARVAAPSFNFPPVDEDRAWAAVAAMREIASKHGSKVATVVLAGSCRGHSS